MLDVVITDNRPLSDAYHAQCVASVHEAAGLAGFPVNVIVTPGNLKAIAQARLAGFDQGSAEYVTFIPDFDYVLPNAFAALGPALRAGAPAVYGRELHLRGGRLTKFPGRHHLAVYRREALESVRAAFETGSVREATAAVRAATARGAVDVHEPTYVRRMGPEMARLFQGAR